MSAMNAQAETSPAMPKSQYSVPSASTGAGIKLISPVMTPGIVADVGEDQHQGRRPCVAREPERPTRRDVAEPVNPKIDAAETDQRRQHDARRDHQAAPRDPGHHS